MEPSGGMTAGVLVVVVVAAEGWVVGGGPEVSAS